MDQKITAAFVAMSVLMCGLCAPKAASGAALPDGKGKAEFVHNCTACHSASMVTRVKKTPDEWRKSVDGMAARGTDGTKEDLDNVVLYLVTNYGTDNSGKPDTAAKPQSTTPSSTSDGPVVLNSSPNSSEIERVKRIISESGKLLSSYRPIGAVVGGEDGATINQAR
jgi:hypothetical protein